MLIDAHLKGLLASSMPEVAIPFLGENGIDYIFDVGTDYYNNLSFHWIWLFPRTNSTSDRTCLDMYWVNWVGGSWEFRKAQDTYQVEEFHYWFHPDSRVRPIWKTKGGTLIKSFQFWRDLGIKAKTYPPHYLQQFDIINQYTQRAGNIGRPIKNSDWEFMGKFLTPCPS